MTTILLILQVLIVITLIVVVLIQKAGADSFAGLSSGGNNLFSSKATSTFLTKLTIILALAFTVNCLVVAKMINQEHKSSASFIDSITTEAQPIKSIDAPEVTE